MGSEMCIRDSRDTHHNGTALGWCYHGSLYGNTTHDHAGVAQLLLDAGAVPEPEGSEASASVQAILAYWKRTGASDER